MDIKEIYKSIREDEQLLDTYDKINQKINFVIDHGRLHVEHVLGYIDLICDALKIEKRTRYLTFIAGMLHDVGRLESREEHSVYSAEFAKNYLKGKLSNADIDIVCEAIKMHDRDYFDYETTNEVAWLLYFADKLDYTRSRYIPALTTENHKTKFSYNIDRFELMPSKNAMTINVYIFKQSDEFEEIFNTRLAEIYIRILAHFKKRTNIVFKLV